MKLTPWFDGSVKPVRVGVYQRDYAEPFHEENTIPLYCYWNGRRWMWAATRYDAEHQICKSTHQHLPWRGLAQQPKGKK